MFQFPAAATITPPPACKELSSPPSLARRHTRPILSLVAAFAIRRVAESLVIPFAIVVLEILCPCLFNPVWYQVLGMPADLLVISPVSRRNRRE